MKCLVLVLAAALAACEGGEEAIKPGLQEQQDEVFLVQLLVSPAEVHGGGGIPDKTAPIVARLLTPDKDNSRRTDRTRTRTRRHAYGGGGGRVPGVSSRKIY